MSTTDIFAWPSARAHRLQQSLNEAEAASFVRSRLRQFGSFPWVTAEALRSAVGLWILSGTGPSQDAAFLALALLLAATMALQRMLEHPFANPAAVLRAVNLFLIVRAIVWALLIGLLIRHAGPRLGVIIPFAATAIVLDLVRMMAVPLIGFLSGALLIVAMTITLLTLPGADPTELLVMGALALGALHYAQFNLHHLFATRHVRTHRLRAANETIQTLLAQYDEHGSDSLVEVDIRGRLQRPSPRLCQMLGCPPEELEGTLLATLFEPGRERTIMLSAARRHHRFRNQVVPLRVGGERRWWSISGAAVFDAEGRQLGSRCFVQDVTEQRATEEAARVMATFDSLTGLFNRSVFTDNLDRALAACAQGKPCGVLFIDLDSFKQVNDSHGHGAGDAVLIAAARRIQRLLGPGAVAARLGGDEFAVLACDVATPEELMRLGSSIVAELSRPVVRDGLTLLCGASAGVAFGPEHGDTGEALLRAADIALYEAKSRGRGQSLVFDPRMLHQLRERRSLEKDLRAALGREEFAIRYQPLIDIASQRTTGYEALLRWNHPERGSVPPSHFIPLAEEIGLIGPIGEWVLREALAEAATWRADLSIAVNVSPGQMRGQGLLGQVVGALAATGVAPQRLELEITEAVMMLEGEDHLHTLHRLQSLGVRIALDDFGTNHSSLNCLRRFPFDKLKIDRCFIGEVVRTPQSRAIVDAVLALAHKLRMKTTAEGIETQAELANLGTMGCCQAQGFLFGQPMPSDRIPIEHRPLRAA